jgi:hypothetical protein
LLPGLIGNAGQDIVTGKGIELAKLLPGLTGRFLKLRPRHIVTGKGIQWNQLLPGLTGRSLELLPGHIVTGREIELAKLLPGLIGNAARTYCYWQGNRVGQIAARINRQCCQDILLLARE